MKISVSAHSRIKCSIRRARYPRLYGIKEVFEVEVAEATGAEAKEVIRGTYLIANHREPFSRVQYEASLFEPQKAWGETGALHALKYAAAQAGPQPPEEIWDGIFDEIPMKVTEIHTHNREALELAINEAARNLLLVDGVLHRRAPAPTISVSLAGRPFIPAGSFEDGGEIVLGYPTSDRDRRAPFLFDVAHHTQARELADMARVMCPRATFTENARVEIDIYDAPASFHQGRHAFKIALSELRSFMELAPTGLPRLEGDPEHPILKVAITEAERLEGLLSLASHDPDTIFRRAREIVKVIGILPSLKADRVQVLQSLFSLAEFAATNSPHDLSLTAVDDPELSNFDF